MSKAKFTIKQISDASGVSVGTVDRYIHNRGHLSSQSRAKIESAISKLESISSNPVSKIGNASYVGVAKVRIGITYPFVEPSFYEKIRIGIDRIANVLTDSLELVEIRTPSHDISAQAETIQKLINVHLVSGLLIAPVNDNYSIQLESCIPKGFPYATLIDDTLGCNRIFHIGPNSYAMGALCAKLLYLYMQASMKEVNAAIISPSATVSGTQERISGFRNMIRTSDMHINIVAIRTIDEVKISDIGEQVYNTAMDLIRSFPELNAIYVTYGFGEWAARAVNNSGMRGIIKVICHESSPQVLSYIEKDIIIAAIDQKPAQQWYNAVMLMYQTLSGKAQIQNKYISAECRLITKETIPLCNDLPIPGIPIT